MALFVVVVWLSTKSEIPTTDNYCLIAHLVCKVAQSQRPVTRSQGCHDVRTVTSSGNEETFSKPKTKNNRRVAIENSRLQNFMFYWCRPNIIKYTIVPKNEEVIPKKEHNNKANN